MSLSFSKDASDVSCSPFSVFWVAGGPLFFSSESANKGDSKLISAEFQNVFEMDVYD